MLGTLRAAYYDNASWLMHRQTGIAFRKKQLTDNQFNQYWTTVGKQDYLHGFPVFYSSAFPVYSASPAVSGAIAFGDFNTAMTIGDRGGPALAISVDSITELKNGKINVLGYRRTDSRVRVSEAVKIWTVNG
jgi:HK97 family phage major capsid protein